MRSIRRRSAATLTLTAEAARRFHRRALGLDAPHTDTGAAIAHHGYVQIDPINVCGRMHDLILRNRVANYAEGDLMRHLHGVPPDAPRSAAPLAAEQRTAFEHYLPVRGILVAFATEAWPHLLASMRAREKSASAWFGRLDADQRRMAARLLDEIARRGPLSSEDIADDARSFNGWSGGWGFGRLARITLDKLFFHGRLLIARRHDTRRVYDLPERVLSASVLGAPAPSAGETRRWLAHLGLRQHRLLPLKKHDAALVADLVQPLQIEGCPALFCLREDLPLLDAAASGRDSPDAPPTRPAGAAPLLLAPLDPLIYHRALTRKLWGLDYIWEVYTPPPKRVRGYYALPLLSGTEFVGYVDPKADRAKRKLHVVKRSVRRGHCVAGSLAGLAKFLGLRWPVKG
ncbi:MAG: winged helix DNA-binding domain-containing protein [Opitutaceae bacterium]|jgi:uncharacterized protein YcaQ|nr:winged helix DNA-binding domain-containing protein [Opitutaceae bacterium]